MLLSELWDTSHDMEMTYMAYCTTVDQGYTAHWLHCQKKENGL